MPGNLLLFSSEGMSHGGTVMSHKRGDAVTDREHEDCLTQSMTRISYIAIGEREKGLSGTDARPFF